VGVQPPPPRGLATVYTSFKSHELTTRPPRLLLLEGFSTVDRKHIARDCLSLCPNCTETRRRASVSSKNFRGYTPDPRFKGVGMEGKREGGIGRDVRKGMGRKER
jgi:hypothetical protein